MRFAVADGAVTDNVASSPMFLGANPAEVRDGDKKGLRVLADEEDAGRALVMALPAELQKQAIVERGRAQRHPDDEQERHQAAAGSGRAVLGAAGAHSRRCCRG